MTLKTWFKVTISVIDSDDLKAHKSRCMGLVSTIHKL